MSAHLLKSRCTQNDSKFGTDFFLRSNWTKFLRKCTKSSHYVIGSCSMTFCSKKWRVGCWHHLVSRGRRYGLNSRSYRIDVCWPSRSWNLIPLQYFLWGAVKDRCYAVKPDAIDHDQMTIFVFWWNTRVHNR